MTRARAGLALAGIVPFACGLAPCSALAQDSGSTVSVSEITLSADTIARAARVQSEGPDALLHLPTRFALGYMLPPTLSPACPEGCFGHPGAGGSLGFADPEAGLGFGYVMNRMELGLTGDPRATRLVEASYAALAAR